jgi:hypothetical protein
LRPGFPRFLQVTALGAAVCASVFAPTWSLAISPDRAGPALVAAPSSLTELRAPAPEPAASPQAVVPRTVVPGFGPVTAAIEATKTARIKAPSTRQPSPARVAPRVPTPAAGTLAPTPSPTRTTKPKPTPAPQAPIAIQVSPVVLTETPAPENSATPKLQKHAEQAASPSTAGNDTAKTAKQSKSRSGDSKNQTKGKDAAAKKDQSKSADSAKTKDQNKSKGTQSKSNDASKSKDQGKSKDQTSGKDQSKDNTGSGDKSQNADTKNSDAKHDNGKSNDSGGGSKNKKEN